MCIHTHTQKMKCQRKKVPRIEEEEWTGKKTNEKVKSGIERWSERVGVEEEWKVWTEASHRKKNGSEEKVRDNARGVAAAKMVLLSGIGRRMRMWSEDSERNRVGDGEGGGGSSGGG